jgi:CHAT domain-containing protein
VDLYKLPPEKHIAALVDSYRGFIENLRDPLDSEFPAGRELSEILLGPVRAQLKPGARLIVVPDRALHSLNLETLPDPDQPSRYLIERVTTVVAPSLGVLIESHRTKPVPPSILLIGDPEPAVEEYPRLPYAAKEMSMIERSFDPYRSVVLQGSRASPAAYREAGPAQFSWIHFAAHATANRESPLDSALILARHDGGYALSARDVMNLPLNADLVTLSACRSAGAKTYSGEGLVGLSWAFLRAGAKNVVAGLWDVTDQSTADLMADFYTQLENHATPAEALRQAKLRLVQSKGAYRKPFYWGPFQLYAGSAY